MTRIADVYVDQRGAGQGWQPWWNGRPVGRAFSEPNVAICAARSLERRLAGTLRDRACLCCRTTFESEGPHNRLCSRCRSEG